MYGWYPENWWTDEVSKNNVSCSDQMLEEFLMKARPIHIQQYPAADNVTSETVAGIVNI